MFFKKSQLKKKLDEAKELLRFGQKVYDYRHDIIDPKDAKELSDSINSLNQVINSNDVTLEKLKGPRDRLHNIAKKCGGTIYPVGFWAENIEMVLVAAILALGIRTFFLQPFTIPTNSMYPSFYGMTSEVYTEENKKPNFAKRIYRTLVLGSSNYEVKSPIAGELLIPLFSGKEAPGYIRFEKGRGTRWFILPTPARMYSFYVGHQSVKIQVPWDFPLEDVVLKTYYPELTSFSQVIEQAQKLKQIAIIDGTPVIKTGIKMAKDQDLLDFDILSGDMLFVDRISYHFRFPEIGDPIVFPTINIKGMRSADGKPEDKYFIKRLVGLGGDILEVKPPILYRNGEPITGAPAFEFNNKKINNYPGYTDHWLLPEKKIEVPQGYFYAMGDNSPHSADSRLWGPVPEKEVIGRAIFIFYPFTKRWGIAH